MVYDYAVIGGGIVGISAAWNLLRERPGGRIVVIEKERGLAQHQTGRNSGVIHAGVYYQPGSLKAKLCKEGAEETLRLCQRRAIPVERCGKLIVATNELELGRLAALEQRTRENAIAFERLDQAELRRREPRISGLRAMFVPSTAIVDYSKVTQALADEFVQGGGEIRTGECVNGVREEKEHVAIDTSRESHRARRAVACAGLFADRVARWCGVGDDFRIVPFRGEYYRLGTDKNNIVSHLIYPVPDPGLPFLGVHLTRMIGGYVTVGPNAVLSFKREGYGRLAFDARDAADTLLYAGFWRLAQQNLRSGAGEFMNSLLKRRYLAQCRKYCPELTVGDLQSHPPGVRAQAVMADGSIVHDFLIRRTRRTIHVCNAPSPAATSALPIGREVARQAAALDA
ncbi:MAG: L-2-hydroxyglutarate oxidase [Nevskia sp.]|nr:L-2-hydroxyglutarate oxidase [Nevskia sp.]